MRQSSTIVALLLSLVAGNSAMAQVKDADGAPGADPFDALKDIPLSRNGEVSVSFGGQLRVRPEFSRNPVFGLAAPQRNDGLLVRTYLSADLQIGQYLKTYVELVSGQVPAWNGTPPSIQLDRLDLLQGYGELVLPSAVGGIMLRGGRQEMSFGSSRLISVRESPNVRRSFDGVRAAWVASPDFRIDAFVTRPVLPQPGVFDDKSDPAQAFWGVYGTSGVPGIPELKLDFYYLGLDRENARFAQGTANEHRHTVGGRLFGQASGFDWNVEAAYQFGQFGQAGIQAWTVSANVGYTFANLPFSPRLGVNADAISGDSNLKDGKLGTFNPLFPKLPYFSEANLAGPANLLDVQPNVTLTLLPELTLNLGWNPLWKQAKADAFYGPAITPVAGTAGGAGRYVGQQFSTTLEWKATDHLTIGGTYVNYIPGERIREAGGKSGSFAAGWATFSF